MLLKLNGERRQFYGTTTDLTPPDSLLTALENRKSAKASRITDVIVNQLGVSDIYSIVHQ